jgi:uncharacterized protein YndB with AHSA1/START domain
MNDEPREPRVIDLSVDVDGTPEEVWEAIATGPGISSWYVPTTVEEREGGITTSRFGEGPEMLIPGVVTVWEPPHRVRFESGSADAGLAFEWLVEARDGGTSVVRLVNSGFDGDEWDAQYDGMREGWQLFLFNLQLHRRHFPGRHGVAMLPMGMWAGPRTEAWAGVLAALGVEGAPADGDRVELTADGAPRFAGTVIESHPCRMAVLVDDPCPGTAFLAAEGDGDHVGVSIWQYLYGPDAEQIRARDEPRWLAWFAAHSPA